MLEYEFFGNIIISNIQTSYALHFSLIYSIFVTIFMFLFEMNVYKSNICNAFFSFKIWFLWEEKEKRNQPLC